jgi:Cu2+-exporting ATPase
MLLGCFFVRAYKSVITWNLNMFNQNWFWSFYVLAYFSQNTFQTNSKLKAERYICILKQLILTLVLLGQLLEAKAHSRTSGAIKLLKLAPTVATLVIEGSDKVLFMISKG